VVSDYGSGLCDETMIAAVVEFAKKKPVCVDSRYALRRFKGVTLAKPNEPELEAMAGRKLRTAQDVEAAGRALLAELGVQALLVTRGHHGMSLFERGKRTVQIPIWGPEEAVDVTGAGDTVLATVAGALGAGASFEAAARLANVAGGVVVQKPGTATCTSAELASALATPEPVTQKVPRPRAGGRTA
jgi:rfaE bifunctional protein kinase chain/domain